MSGMSSSCRPWPASRRGLVAILRGVTPAEVAGIADALVEAGIDTIEVPLNSPDPFASIRILTERHGNSCLIGAGTVLTPEDVKRLEGAGGQLVVSPNVDPAVLESAAALKLVSMPGVFSPTEALLAVRHGASALKVFPASALGPAGISAIRAVLPGDTVTAAVGGIAPDDFAAYAKAGVGVFGLGSSLYKPGDEASAVRERARSAVAAYEDIPRTAS